MKTIKGVFRRSLFITSLTAFIVLGTASVDAQPILPDPGTNSPPTVVGGQYQVQGNNDLTTTNWFSVGGIISARLTNVVTQVPKTNTMQFYRIIQLP